MAGPPGGSGQRVDTIVVHREHSETCPVVARYTDSADGPLTLDGCGPVTQSGVEYGYEADGIPVLELGADTAWMRVLYGTDTLTSQPRIGWVRAIPGRVGFVPWIDLLMDRGWLFFRSERDGPYHATPGGRRVDVSHVRPGGMFALYAEQVRGDWMLVRVESPSEHCDLPPPVARQSFVWVRALDERGRPLLSYPSRGC